MRALSRISAGWGRRSMLLGGALLFASAGCLQSVPQANPFLSLTEQVLGVGSGGDDDDGGGGGGGGGGGNVPFRRTQTITLVNTDGATELNVSLAAWVGPNSLRDADQQDALFVNGYRQLNREETLGTLSLAPGTFVLGGPGPIGANLLRLEPGESRTFNIITPDRVLLFSAPPVSCDTVGFFFTIDGEPMGSGSRPDTGIDFEGATRSGGLKTLAQFDVYECDPLQPGLFLRLGGGTKSANEFFEGEAIRVEFRRVLPADDAPAAEVTIGS